MEIQFKNANAKRVYQQFLTSVDNQMIGLKKADCIEIQNELTSHIYESMASSTTHLELENLLDAIEKLGSLDDIIKPIVADCMIQYASTTLNPNTLITAFHANSGRKIQRFVIGLVLALFSMLTFSFLAISTLKLFYPEIGLWVGVNTFVLGAVDNHATAREVLGYWIIPISASLAFILYLLASLSLKLIKGKK